MKKQPKPLPRQVEEIKRSGAGLASTTKGRARVFKNRKKENNKRACRRPVEM